MGYQAPLALLAAVVTLALAYGWFWWRQSNLTLGCPCLALVVDDQGEFLEGLLRQFLWWCTWHGSPWQLLVFTDASARATLAILRHLFYPYPCNFFWVNARAGNAAPGGEAKNSTVDWQELALASSYHSCRQGRVHLLDLRQEISFNSARARLYQICLKN